MRVIPSILLSLILPFRLHAETLLNVVTTTGMIADLVRNVGGEFVNVSSLMGEGVDPHLYKATQGDLKRLLGADLILYNGLHLEGKMADTLEKLSKSKPVYAASRDIPVELLGRSPEFEGQYDPHIWFDVNLWMVAAKTVGEILSSRLPAHASQVGTSTSQYLLKLSALDDWVKQEINRIPSEQRILVTAHDAFGYFGAAYGIEVMGLQGISTASEFGLKDISDLANIIISRKVKAIFVESSVPKRFIVALQEGVKSKGHNVNIGGELYSDSMGPLGSPEGNYLGMVRSNVNTIVKALL